jgi:hypothetical protein
VAVYEIFVSPLLFSQFSFSLKKSVALDKREMGAECAAPPRM